MSERGAAPPLAGIRILDFTRVLAGPWCSMNLADLGAEVIKVENPSGGDDTRRFPPITDSGESGYFLLVNRNKKSVTIDISEPEGRDIVCRLAGEVDVVLENFRPDVMQRHGLDYGSLSADNPGLIYCSISGYGHNGGMTTVAGYDPVAQAESGLMALTGEPDGDPMRTNVALVDIITGLYAAQAILAALRARDRDGKGQFIDMTLIDCAVAATANLGQAYLTTGEAPTRSGNGSHVVQPLGLYRCADGPMMLCVGNDRQYRRLCHDVIDRPDLADDPRFEINADRIANQAALRAILDDILGGDTRDHWIAKMRANGVPAGSVRTVPEALTHDEILGRGMVREIDHPAAGPARMTASPMRLSGTPVIEPGPSPTLGQHTDEVLTGLLGLDTDRIAALRAAGAIGNDGDS